MIVVKYMIIANEKCEDNDSQILEIELDSMQFVVFMSVSSNSKCPYREQHMQCKLFLTRKRVFDALLFRSAKSIVYCLIWVRRGC